MHFIKSFFTAALFVLLAASMTQAKCMQFIELWPPEESGFYGNINVWAKTTEQGKHPKVGELRPGSRALLLTTSKSDFKIKSPLDGSVGWVNKGQVKRILMQDDKTFEPCR